MSPDRQVGLCEGVILAVWPHRQNPPLKIAVFELLIQTAKRGVTGNSFGGVAVWINSLEMDV